MATIDPENSNGAYAVNDRCINCSLCSEIAPQIFATNHDEGYEYVKKQPETEKEFALVAEAADICPADAISNHGVREFTEADPKRREE